MHEYTCDICGRTCKMIEKHIGDEFWPLYRKNEIRFDIPRNDGKYEIRTYKCCQICQERVLSFINVVQNEK